MQQSHYLNRICFDSGSQFPAFLNFKLVEIALSMNKLMEFDESFQLDESVSEQLLLHDSVSKQVLTTKDTDMAESVLHHPDFKKSFFTKYNKQAPQSNQSMLNFIQEETAHRKWVEQLLSDPQCKTNNQGGVNKQNKQGSVFKNLSEESKIKTTTTKTTKQAPVPEKSQLFFHPTNYQWVKKVGLRRYNASLKKGNRRNVHYYTQEVENDYIQQSLDHVSKLSKISHKVHSIILCQ